MLLLAAAACGTDDRPPSPPREGTWYGEVGPIVRAKCAGCHHEGGIAPFPLAHYEDAVAQMGRIVDAIDTGIMPPWFTDEASGCTPDLAWKDDARLTEDERIAIHRWADAGGPKGTLTDLPALTSTSLDNAALQLAPKQPFASTGDVDQFVCVLLDPKLDRTQWITASQVFPTSPQLVHHANVYIVPPGDVAAAKTQFGGFGVQQLPCDHPPGLAIQSWLPGNPALLLPEGVGIPIEAGSAILLQLHYHPAGVGGMDASSVAFRTTAIAPEWTYYLGVFGNATSAPVLQPGDGDPSSGPAFVVPADVEDHVERMWMPQRSVPYERRVLSVTPHMHLLGTHETVWLEHTDGARECLVDGGWSFDWQRTYTYDGGFSELPQVEGESTIDLTCHWNNTFTNPQMTRLLKDANRVAPYDVWFGYTTIDEMCLADLGMIAR